MDEDNTGLRIDQLESTERIFKISTKSESRLRYFDSTLVNSVVYENSLALTKATRVEYGLLHFFSDVGGLFGLTLTVGELLTVLFTLDGPQSFVAAEMLKTSDDKRGVIRDLTGSV